MAVPTKCASINLCKLRRQIISAHIAYVFEAKLTHNYPRRLS